MGVTRLYLIPEYLFCVVQKRPNKHQESRWPTGARLLIRCVQGEAAGGACDAWRRQSQEGEQ